MLVSQARQGGDEMTVKITRRMKQIVKILQDNPGAYIQEQRDASRERSDYYIRWKSADGKYFASSITERMLDQLEAAGLVRQTEHTPIHNKAGEFVTSQGVWDLVRKEESK